MSDRLCAQVDVELAQLRQLLAVHDALLNKCRTTAPDRVELSALGMVLHSFYMGVENIFKRIAMEIDVGIPKSENWHRDLLAGMAQESLRRRSVISGELQEVLKDYLGFRHIFRNSYSFDLEWPEMAPLVLECQATLDRFAGEVRGFLAEPGPPTPPPARP